jgi:ABC-type branched-subunit amino acid transport system permease subunit
VKGICIDAKEHVNCGTERHRRAAVHVRPLRYGRAVKAIRDDEIAAGASGLNTTYLKVLVFAISAFFAGIAGGIFAQYIGSEPPLCN